MMQLDNHWPTPIVGRARKMMSLARHCLLVAACSLALANVGHTQGNSIKRSLAEFGPDLAAIKAAGAKLYENEDVPIGTIEEWSNPETGGTGKIELVEIFEHQGMPCRKLLHNAKPGKSETQRFTITRCKTADGSWKIL